MIRRTTHSLKFATNFKGNKLDDFFAEYERVVNQFIDMFWTLDKLPSKINSEVYHKIDSWLLGKAMKCAGNQAIKIVKSTWKKNNQLTYKKYKKIFSKCKKNDRNINGILDKKWKEWIKDKTFRRQCSKPFFNGNTIDLNSDLVKIRDSKKSTEFDLWIRIGSVFGNRFSLILPTKKHKNFNKHLAKGFDLRKSITLRKDHKSKYFVDLFLEKKEDETIIKKQDNSLGIDTGINKLFSLSDGTFLGTDIKRLLTKLNRKVQGSKRYNKCLREIKHYIGQSVNKIDFDQLDLIVMEDLKNITKNTKGRTNKTLRKQLGHWNIKLVFDRIINKCELNRVWFELVNPQYTSQTCSRCQVIDKTSRKGEVYECSSCGASLDADTNASINILSRFLDKECTVPYGQKGMPKFS